MDGKQLLRDPNVEPTKEIIAEGLGKAGGAYTKFIGELEKHSIQVEWRYYKDGKSWLGKALYKWTTSKGTQKETTAFWLSVWEGYFKVSIFVPEKARADALALPLGNEVKKMIESSEQMGKLKLFPMIFDLDSDKLFKDIFTLAEFRVKIK